jgi:receptor expression-enhancing protein 5/6
MIALVFRPHIPDLILIIYVFITHVCTQDDLKRELDKVPVLHRVEHAVKVPKQYLVAGVAAVLLICLLSGHGAAFICNVIGFLYPTHQSFRAIESANKKDTTQW